MGMSCWVKMVCFSFDCLGLYLFVLLGVLCSMGGQVVILASFLSS